MDFVNELKKKIVEINQRIDNKKKIDDQEVTRYYSPIRIGCIKYNIVIKDLEGKVIKKLAWGLALEECLMFAKLYNKSKLIKELSGLFSLQYVKELY